MHLSNGTPHLIIKKAPLFREPLVFFKFSKAYCLTILAGLNNLKKATGFQAGTTNQRTVHIGLR